MLKSSYLPYQKGIMKTNLVIYSLNQLRECVGPITFHQPSIYICKNTLLNCFLFLFNHISSQTFKYITWFIKDQKQFKLIKLKVNATYNDYSRFLQGVICTIIGDQQAKPYFDIFRGSCNIYVRQLLTNDLNKPKEYRVNINP